MVAQNDIILNLAVHHDTVMVMKLKATRYDCYFTNSDGEDKRADAEVAMVLDPEFGWQASITLSSWGQKTPAEALLELQKLTQRFASDIDKLIDQLPPSNQ